MNRQFSQFLVPFLLVMVLPVPAPAQDDSGILNLKLPPALRLVKRPTLSEEAEWALLVHQSGGFSGVSQAVTIDSTGVLGCAGFQAPCEAAIELDTLNLLDREIANTVPDNWSGSLVPCSDCLSRTVILVLKDSEEQTTEHIAYWNVAVPESAADASGLHRMVRDLLFPE